MSGLQISGQYDRLKMNDNERVFHYLMIEQNHPISENQFLYISLWLYSMESFRHE